MVIKGRPKKVRYIQKMPSIIQFSPRGRAGRPDEIELSIDQFEAIKLADYQGFSQAQGALVMKLSRPSFGRILRQARKKVSDALVNGKIIKIRMGNVQIGVRKKEFSLDSLDEELLRFQSRNKRVVDDISKVSVGSKRRPVRQKQLS